MNCRLILTLVPLAGLLVTGCDKPQSQASAPAQTTPVAEPAPLPPAPPAPAGPSESEQRLEAQMQAMQDRQAELQRQLDEEKLARLEAEIAKERDLLEKEREAWRLEQELADAKAKAAATPSRTPSQEGGDVVSASYSSAGSYDYQTFYDDLAPYGAWYDSPDYGYVWQPSVYVSDTSWRPYTCGSWAHSDAGWTWCSDEPFGWATYHYGRWGRCRQRGWVWVPGDVWAPAWVSWRRSDSHVGWCPLPPETVYHRNVSWGVSIDTDCGIHPSMYIFMPVRHFDRPVLRYCEPAAVSIQICGTTANITNIFWRGGRVHCEGPKYDWIHRSVQRPVPQYTLAWDGGRPVNGTPAHRMEKDRLHVFAPKMDVPWNRTLQPRTKAGRLEQTEFVRADGGVPQKMQEQFRREKASREQAAVSSKSGRYVMERQQRLAEMEKSRQSLAAETQKQAETPQTTAADRSRPDRFSGKSGRVVSNQPAQTQGDAGNVQPATPPQPETPVPDARRTAKTPVNGGRVEDPRRQRDAEQGRAPEPAKSAPVVPAQTPAADAAEAEKQRLANEAAARESAARADAKTSGDRSRMEAIRRQRDEAAKQAAAERAAAQEQQERAAETAARNEAAKRELDNQRAQRAQMEEQRRRNEAAKEQADAERASSEKARRDNEAATRERTKAAMEERRRQQQEAAEAQASAAAKRAELENQRRQAEAARAEQAARQREAMEQRAALEEQRRQAQAEAQQRRAAEEAAARQREAMESQRRAAQAEAAREQQRQAAQEAAARQREAMENQRRAAEENARRQAEDSARRQAAENAQREAMDKARRASEEAERRQSEDRGGGRRGK